jgi:hypothetical protein
MLARLFFHGPFFDERQPLYWNWRTLPPKQLIPVTKLNGGMMAFRREVLEDVGGFDERLRGSCVAEDIDITQRVLAFVQRPEAVVLTPAVGILHESLGQWKRKDRTIEFQLVAQHYLLCKNLAGDIRNRVWFGCMALGVLVLSCLSALRNSTLAPLSSFRDGIRCIRSGYQDCPFLKGSDEAGPRPRRRSENRTPAVQGASAASPAFSARSSSPTE